jgi:hypothetical protein
MLVGLQTPISPCVLIMQIGLMRNGRLLTEKSPEILLQEYNTSLLEDIVIQLCKNDSSRANYETVIGVQDSPLHNGIVASSDEPILGISFKQTNQSTDQNCNSIDEYEYPSPPADPPSHPHGHGTHHLSYYLNTNRFGKTQAIIVRNALGMLRNPL